MKYAWVENNKIRDICTGDPAGLFTPEIATFYATEVADYVQAGWVLIEGVWTATVVHEPVDTNTYLYITSPSLSVVNTPINLTVEVKFADNSLAPVQSTYYVPVLRLSDSKQIAFLTIEFLDGAATVSFTPSEPGIYIMDTSKIRPVPTSIIVSHPEIIVV